MLDVAAGTGNAAIAAASAGAAVVVASDLTPELFDAGRARAADLGVQVTWREADSEALPFADAEFEVVLSSIGLMFAPNHQAAADELLRVCRPGGRIGLLNWTPEGFVGRLFETMHPYSPPPPPGAQPGTRWGNESYVRSLLGDRVTDVQAQRSMLRVELFTQPGGFREYFKRNYGPAVSTYRFLRANPARAAAVDAELDALAANFGEGGGAIEWEYLAVTAAVPAVIEITPGRLYLQHRPWVSPRGHLRPSHAPT